MQEIQSLMGGFAVALTWFNVMLMLAGVSLGVLIGAHRRLKLRGGSLVVVCDNEAIVKTFRITGLDGVFTLVRSLDDALDGDAVSAGG